jgi:predicted outer membrane repeat protein
MKACVSLLICTAVLLPLSVRAMEVTLCTDDTQKPSGGNVINLQTALQAGGVITFKCGGPATIHLKNTYTIQRDTTIIGGGTITLDGGHNWFGMFLGSGNAISLTVNGVHIVNAGRFAKPGDLGRIHGNFIGGKFGVVQLESVTVESSVWPVWLDTGGLLINASRFSNNDGSVVIGSDIQVLNHSVFSNNRSGTIRSVGGNVTIADSQFLSNTGPAIVSGGTLKVSHTNFTNNVSGGNGGALRIGSNATIEESDFYNNGAANGGAIFIRGNTATVSLRALKFHSNVATQTGGAVSFEKSQLPLMLTVLHTTFQENRANMGGAMTLERDFRNNLFMNGSAVAFIGNQAMDSGGAIYAPNAGIALSRGVFIGNHAGTAGGAIYAYEQNNSKVAFANSLVVRNSAPKGSAFWGNRASFINSTLADNDGTSVWPQAPPLGPTLATTPFFIEFMNSIVAGSVSTPCGTAPASVPYTGGNNLQFPGTGCGAGFAVAYPSLGPYYVPFFWSPAIGAGNASVCQANPINNKDVYNVRRPLGRGSCTIGAAEGSIQHLIERWRSRESGLSFSSKR